MILRLRIVVLLVFVIAVAGCGTDDSNPSQAGSITLAKEFIDEHWSNDFLYEAYNPASTDSERSGQGEVYFPHIDGVSDIGSLDMIPLWVSRAEEEEEFMQIVAIWDQFIYGWDDYTKASIARPEYQYVPTLKREDLSQPWVSPNRDRYRELLGVILPR